MGATIIRQSHFGAMIERLSWNALVQLFDVIFGSEARVLRGYPDVLGPTKGHWIDADGRKHVLSQVDELREPYASGSTYGIFFNGWRLDKSRMRLRYWPGRLRAAVHVESPDQGRVERAVSAAQSAFPLDYRTVFISYSGARDRGAAYFLQELLNSRVPQGTTVFIAPREIKTGADWAGEIGERLKDSRALFTLCSASSRDSQWLHWEAGAAWAAGAIVAPLFIDLSPGQFGGPIPTYSQGRPFFDAEEVGAAIAEVLSCTLGVSLSAALSDSEIETLRRVKEDFESATATVEITVMARTDVPNDGGLQWLHLQAEPDARLVEARDARVRAEIAGNRYAFRWQSDEGPQEHRTLRHDWPGFIPLLERADRASLVSGFGREPYTPMEPWTTAYEPQKPGPKDKAGRRFIESTIVLPSCCHNEAKSLARRPNAPKPTERCSGG